MHFIQLAMAQHVYSYYHYLLLAAILVLLPYSSSSSGRAGTAARLTLPGPWRLPVIGSMHHLVGALPHRAMRDLARRLGAPLMLLRLGELRVVVASSAAAAKAVMRTHDAALATRPMTSTIRALTRDGLGVVFAPQGEHWRQIRKLCVTELLSARRVRALRGSREAEAAALVASIAALSASPEPANVSSLLATYVTDAAVRAVVGDRIGSRDAFLECLDEGVKVAAGFSLADLFPSSRLARAFSGTARRAELHRVKMNWVMDGVLEEHRARRSSTAGAGDEEEDLLDVLLRLQTDGGLHVPLETGSIRAVITDLFGAGSETSATTLQWAMTELMREPRALRRAQAEVRGAFAGESRVREESLPELRYLQLVIKETLRLHPAVPLLVPRECQEPCRVLGYDVPVGAMVLVNAWAIGRDVESWGADAEEFRPERFEEAGNCAVDFRGTDFELVPFGAGRRMCPGIALGIAVMELALASLLFHFDWELPGGGAPRELDMTEGVGISARRKTDLWLHATLRVPPNSL